MAQPMPWARWAGRLPLAVAALAALLPVAAAGQDDARNRVSFRVEARREVANDWATADIGVVQQGRNPAKLAAAARQRLVSSLDLAKRTPGVIASDGSYRTHPIYDRDSPASGRIVGWRVNQSMKLESGDLEALGALLDELQGAGLVLHDLRMGVSPKTLGRVEDELIAEALGMYRSRANLIAQGLGRSDWTLVDLIVGDATPLDRNLGVMGLPEGAVAPLLPEGMSEISITLDATIEIK
ncbi:MAG: SIMPL domain-containing protein [Deltaproteobacteria bacterium]|nr:SIMPL domain-containing protein [Deltaproteobacteria bacterium]